MPHPERAMFFIILHFGKLKNKGSLKNLETGFYYLRMQLIILKING